MVTKEDCIKIGEIVKTHSLDGEVVVATENNLLEKYAEEPVFLLLGGAPVPFFIAEEGVAYRNHTSYIVKFDHIDSVDRAEHLLGCEVLLERAALQEDAEEDAEDLFTLIGFEVRDLSSGKTGKVTDVADYAGNVVLSLSIFDKEVLLPFSENYVCSVDFEHEYIQTQIPQELAELN